MSVFATRAHFPRGLIQPEGGFRFGADALLLACFGASLPGRRVLDLGTGCGPAGLGLLLARDDAQTRVCGLDHDPAMVAAATANAAHLGLADRFCALSGDVRDIRANAAITPESFGLVLANPPYRDPDSGRRPEGAQREAARFETAGDLADFATAAAYALENGGGLALVHLAERLGHIFACLADSRLEIKRILPIASRREAPARQVLVWARKNSRPGLRLEPALALYEGAGAATRLSPEALRFCPFLACNAGQRAATHP